MWRTDRQTDRQTDKTERSVLRAAWSQLKMKIVLLNERYLLQLLYSCCSMKVTSFSYCIPAALWKLFALLYSCSSIWVACFSQFSCCSMDVTSYSYCTPASLWMLSALVTVLLLLYESYLHKLLYFCHDDKDANAIYISLEMYEAWHLHNWLLEAYQTP